MKDAAAPAGPPPMNPSRKSQKTYGARDIAQPSGHASENEFDVRKARS